MPRTDLVNRILEKVEEEVKQEGNKPHTIGVYRASEIGSCARALGYATLGEHTPEPLTAETHMIFKDGHLHHDAVRGLLAKIGTVSHRELTVSKKYKHNGEKFVITGTVDLVFDNEVVDIKSISTFRFKYIDKHFPGEYMNYVEQVTIYEDILGIPKGGLLFKDKNTAELKFKRVNFQQPIMDGILDKVAHIHKMLREKKLVDRPYGVNTWHCKLCQYRIHCWKVPMEVRRWNASKAPEDALASRVRARHEAKVK